MPTATRNNGGAAPIGLDEKKTNAEEQRILRDVVRRCAIESASPGVSARPSAASAAGGPAPRVPGAGRGGGDR